MGTGNLADRVKLQAAQVTDQIKHWRSALCIQMLFADRQSSDMQRINLTQCWHSVGSFFSI
jgi:hypothetical protein